MKNLKDLQAQLAEVNRKIAAEDARFRSEALATAKELVKRYELTADEVFGQDGKAKKCASTVEPKYRDPVSGATWTGRGKEPTWIRGKLRANFLINV